MKTEKPLSGTKAICFESRLSDSAALMLEKYGTDVISAPSMQEVPLEEHGEVFEFGDLLFGGDVDVLVCMTGVGTRMMIDTLRTRHEMDKILMALTGLTIVVRGPKPVTVLKELGVSYHVNAPEPNTWEELLEAMNNHPKTRDLAGKTVAVQEYGETNEPLMDSLRERGAEVVQVPVYRWALPDDTEPLKKGLRAVLDGEVEISVFTSKTQIHHVMEMAAADNVVEKFREALNKTFVASVGPVCTKGLESQGIHVDFEPTRPKLGVFIKELSLHFPNLAV